VAKSFFKALCLLYVCFAVWSAYTYTPPFDASTSDETEMKTEAQLTLTGRSKVHIGKEYSKYTIRVWSASWCAPCKRYKATQIPKLEALGFKVEVFDIDVDETPKYVRAVPTVEVIYRGKTLKHQTYWEAENIKDFVDTFHQQEPTWILSRTPQQ